MINWQRIFDVYRTLADSFDGYLRTVVFRQQLKGFIRLERMIVKMEEAEKKSTTKLK